MDLSLLDQIVSPADLRKLPIDKLPELAAQIRERIFNAVSRNGGHLASNLGVVELTIALHYVYDFGPYPTGPDRLLFDVGHQCYPHKMLTGRAGDFDQLRKKGHVGGFPMPEESPYDLFTVGHAGTAISTAVGMARGDQLQGHDSQVVALVGDASIVNGLAFEGLNNAGTLKRQLLIILNDNGMSISRPQGAFGQYLERVRVSTTFSEAKKLAERVMGRLPESVGQTVQDVWRHMSDGFKSVMWPGQIFETLGLMYMGPVDGHDMPGLINLLAEIRHVKQPILLHVKTIKGKGYDIISSEPTKFHSPSAFSISGCQVELKKKDGKSWTTAFADALIEIAQDDPRVFALTAGMPDGTGLSKFEKSFPDRYMDTGICESHLLAMAAGMCKSGLRPVASIYSTFMQRAFDQIWQEVTLQQLPVILAMDRAGYVGEDGAVHHGFMDQAFLRPMPGMVLMAPSDEAELGRCLRLATKLQNVCALRYPRDIVPSDNFEQVIDPSLRGQATQPWRVGISRVLRNGEDATLIVYGALAGNVMQAAETLSSEGIDVEVIDARFCKPVDAAMLKRVLRNDRVVVTVEDHALINGFGSAVLEYAIANGLNVRNLRRLGHPDRMIPHASRTQQLTEAGLDAGGIAGSLRDMIREARRRDSVIAAAHEPN